MKKWWIVETDGKRTYFVKAENIVEAMKEAEKVLEEDSVGAEYVEVSLMDKYNYYRIDSEGLLWKTNNCKGLWAR